MRPIVKSWEQELNRKLLFEKDKGTRFFRFNMDALLRGDTKSRGEYFTRALGSVSTPAWLTPNEVRSLDNRNPVEGGDVLYNPTLNKGADADSSEGDQNTSTDEEGQQQEGATE
jgi:phage portal protein BeeE